ncbi:peptidoglycan bridge formation glycyltransferase FemA/FemB family protein [Candidatus Uhrbacteria bacterium]|nr:peptidoglycan bridge formation glycyltransferase FemA/FemB family protein [Candidatus Uhrbacteria bacterium]
MRHLLDIGAWNTIVAGQPHSPFLQSYEWGEFQKIIGHRVERFSLYSEGKGTAIIQMFVYALAAGYSYLYLPHGPVGEYGEEEDIRLKKELQEVQKRTKAVFLRWESQKGTNDFFFCRAQKKIVSTQPQTTLFIELDKTEEALLAEMHPKTRYNIRLAGKHGVQIRVDDFPSSKIQKEFLFLLKETAQRDHFHLHQEAYYRTLFQLFQKKSPQNYPQPFVRLYTAYANEQLLAGALVLFFGDTATYVHGASSSAQRNIMAPFALHWHIIKEAKMFGYRYYDFWGVADTDDPSHPWAGLTRFKKGFGGTVISYPSARDCIFSPFLYTLYSCVRAVRRTYTRSHP